MTNNPQINRIYLRSPQPLDAERVWHWRKQPGLNLHQPLVDLSYSQLREDLLNFAYRPDERFNRDRFHWIIERIADQAPIGWITLSVRNRLHQIGEIGYSLAEEYHGQGYGSEAVRIFLHLAFTELNLYRIEAKCSIHNTASYHLLEKCGFRREGLLRQYLEIRHERVDHYLYAVLKSDWLQK